MKDIDLSYYAGLFDGEGCISINHHKPQRGRRTEQHTLRCHVAMNNQDLIYSLKEHFKGNVKFSEKSKKNPHWHDIWTWTVESNQALAFLQTIYPFLRLKQPEAILAIEFQKARSGQRGKRALSSEELKYRQDCYEKLSSMKGTNRRTSWAIK